MAIIHPDFFFVHFQRTGGTSLSEWLLLNIPDTEIVAPCRTESTVWGEKSHCIPDSRYDWWSGYGKHISAPTCELFGWLKDRFTFSTIRNPFDWYVSVWSHTWYHMPFKDFIMAPLTLTLPPVWQTEDFQANTGNIGPMTLRYFNTFCKREDGQWWCLIDHFLRYERDYPETVREMFNEHLFPLSEKQLETLDKLPRHLAAKHGHYREYYDAESIEFVKTRDRFFFKEFGFEF